MKNSKKSKIPKFRSYEQEAKFWDAQDSTKFKDLEPADLDFSKSPKKLVSMRLPQAQIEALKKIAAKRGIGYLSMIRMWVTDRLMNEAGKKAA